jgi:hypothetical protein
MLASQTSARKRKRPLPEYTSKEYTSLPNKRNYIRLLNLKAHPGNALIECELIVTKFDKENEIIQPYEALSWCWGTAKADSPIVIRKNGVLYEKYVSPELVAALKTLRYPRDDRFLWIDAVCIDQSNNYEKNHQVEMMSDIYGRAENVCVWLGEGDADSKMALTFIKKDVLQLQNFDELCDNKEANKKWGALLNLMQRPWFSRRWVVQEIALARKAVVYCGTDQISWKKFAVAVELFVEVEMATHRLSEVMKKDPQYYHIPGWFEYVSALGASLLVEATGKLFRDYKPNGPLDISADAQSEASSQYDSDSEDELDRITEGNTDSEDASIQPLLSLEYLVSSLSIFQATVPHDIIYALLAIAKDTTPVAGEEESKGLSGHTQNVLEVFTQKKRYKVEYERPFVDVCKDFVLFCIEHSDKTRALDILCRPWAPEDQSMRSETRAERKIKRRRKPKTADVATQTDMKDGGNFTDAGQKSELHPSIVKMKENLPLPSWIPQLSGAAYAMYPQAGVHTLKMGRKNADTLVGLPPSNQSLQRNYNAAQTKQVDVKALKFRRRSSLSHFSMYVKGFILDIIDQVQPASQGGAIPTEWAQTAGWENAPRSEPPDDFWRTLVADRGRDGRNPPVYYSRACKESFFKGGFSSGSVNTTDLINNERCSVVAQFCRRVQSVIWNRCLIKTKETKRLGLANQNVKVKDYVCILYGCSVPVILRRRYKTLGTKNPDGEDYQAKNDVDPNSTSPSEVEQEVEEDVQYWRYQFADRLARSWRRIETSRDRRDEAKEVYRQWDMSMKKDFWKDGVWRTTWQEHQTRRLQKERDHIDSLARTLKDDYLTRDGYEKCRDEPSKCPMKCPAKWTNEEYAIKWWEDASWRDEWIQKEKARIIAENEALTELSKVNFFKLAQDAEREEAERERAEREKAEREEAERIKQRQALTRMTRTEVRRAKKAEKAKKTTKEEVAKRQKLGLSAVKYLEVNTQGHKALPGRGEDLTRRKHQSPSLEVVVAISETGRFGDERTIERWKRKMYTDWKRHKHQEAKEEDDKREAREKKEGQIPKKAATKKEKAKEGKVKEPEKEVTMRDKPRVDWEEFELYLKFGRRWKRLVQRRKELAKELGEMRKIREERLRVQARLGCANGERLSQIHERSASTKKQIFEDKKEDARKRSMEETTAQSMATSGLQNGTGPRSPQTNSLGTSTTPKPREMSDAYMSKLRELVREKYLVKPDIAVTEDDDPEIEAEEKAEQKKIEDHNRRANENMCYYEFLGEAYIHGMMDGEAMAYQNAHVTRQERELQARVFELR